MTDRQPTRDRAPHIPWVARAVLVVAMLYVFLGGVKLLESGIKALGSDFTDALFESVTNPLAGLFVGMLATVLVQSSSVSTSTIVALVAGGIISVDSAVPMIMGANIGTTVTNTIIALAHMRRSEQFRRAFAAATMHDWFNLIAVALLLPLQITTEFLSKSAAWLTDRLVGGEGLSTSFNSPIKGAVSRLADVIESGLAPITSNETAAAVILIVVGIGLIIFTLAFITKNMRVLVADRIERSLNAALQRSGLVGMAVGVVVTIAVQSSSITTSLLIPLVASGVLAIRSAFPITLGANVGTTATALLAAFGAGQAAGLTIALTHTLFNLTAIAIMWPIPRLRYLPVQLAEWLGDVAVQRRSVALAYTFGLFVVLPLIGIVVL